MPPSTESLDPSRLRQSRVHNPWSQDSNRRIHKTSNAATTRRSSRLAELAQKVVILNTSLDTVQVDAFESAVKSLTSGDFVSQYLLQRNISVSLPHSGSKGSVHLFALVSLDFDPVVSTLNTEETLNGAVISPSPTKWETKEWAELLKTATNRIVCLQNGTLKHGSTKLVSHPRKGFQAMWFCDSGCWWLHGDAPAVSSVVRNASKQVGDGISGHRVPRRWVYLVASRDCASGVFMQFVETFTPHMRQLTGYESSLSILPELGSVSALCWLELEAFSVSKSGESLQ